MRPKSLDFRIRKMLTISETEKKLQRKQPSRVYVNEEAILELTGSKDGGRAVRIEKIGGGSEGTTSAREATLWRAPEKLDKAVTQMYDVFRDTCGYRLGDQVRITVLGGTLPDAKSVVFEEVRQKEGGPAPLMTEEEKAHWAYNLGEQLSIDHDHVYPGLVTKRVLDRSFMITFLNGQPSSNARYQHGKTSVSVTVAKEGQVNSSPRGKLEVMGIRGLNAQMEKLNDFFRLFNPNVRLRSFGNPCGLIIHGPHGTGKSMLLDRISDCGWGAVFRVQGRDKLSEISETFRRAQAQQPSMVLIDDLHSLIDKERTNRNAVIQAICDAFNALAKEASAKKERPQVVVTATCLDLVTDVPPPLRDPRRFGEDIFLPLPDIDARRQILASFGHVLDPAIEVQTLQDLSARTHAYTGKDLQRLFDKAYNTASIRLSKNHRIPDDNDPEHEQYVQPEDFTYAMQHVRPSAMHDINLKPPPIHWNDIGGQEHVKAALRVAVAMSTAPPELLDRFVEYRPKGFLLYGPPGCSKTMAAQAMATESGLNFFAVKGAELLNMYVGESERAVRRLFQRAREVAPSMIFFDEIDSIAGQRSGFGSGGSSSSTTSHGGVNVLTTLLNEMDGFETMAGVLVLAATNRPQVLDPALLRPGRFTKLIYVSPPDARARDAIFDKIARKRGWIVSKNVPPDTHAAHCIDIARLTAATEGYSGAEIVGICEQAGTEAFARLLEGVGKEVKGQGTTMADLEQAIRNQPRQITKDMLEGYSMWEKKFRQF